MVWIWSIGQARPSDDDDRTRMMLMIAADMCPPDSTVFTVRHARAAPRDLNICEQTGSFFTNTFFTLDKCIQQFRQIHFAIWTKTIYSEACTPCIGRTTARDLNICEQTVSHLSPDQIFDSPPNILQHIFCIKYSRSNIWVFVSKLVPICQHIKSLLLFAIVAKEDL